MTPKITNVVFVGVFLFLWSIGQANSNPLEFTFIGASGAKLDKPHDLGFAPDGNIWPADAGNNHMVLLWPELIILRKLRGAPHRFNGARYQDVLPDGTLIVVDKYNHAIKIISLPSRLNSNAENRIRCRPSFSSMI